MHNLPKILRFLIYIFLGILAISILISLLANPVGKRILENQVARASGGQYSLQLENLNISLLQQKVNLQGIVLQTNLPRRENAPLIDLNLRELTVAGFSWLYLLIDDQLIVDRIVLDGLNLQIELHGEAANKTETFQLDQLDIYPQIEDQFEQILINHFQIIDSKFKLQTTNSQDTLLFSFQNVNLRTKDFLLDADQLFTDSRTFYAESIILEGGKFTIEQHSKDAWQAGIDHIQLKTEQNHFNLLLESLNFLQEPEGEPDKMLFIELQEFVLQGLDLNKLQEEEIAYSQKLLISDLIVGYPENQNSTQSEKGKDTTEEPQKFLDLSLGTNFPAFVKQILMDEMEIKRFSIRAGNNFELGEANILARDLIVDKNPAFSDNRFLHAKALEVDVRQLYLKAGVPLHQLNLSRFQIDVAEGKGDIFLHGIGSQPISGSENENMLYAKIDLVGIKGINLQQLTSGALAVESIQLETPSWKLFINEQINKEKEPYAEANEPFQLEQLDIYPMINRELKRIQIGDLIINSSDFGLRTTSLTGMQEFSYHDFTFASKDILLEENEMFSGERSFYAKENDLEIQNVKMYSQGQDFFQVETDLIQFNSQEEMGNVSAQSINFLQKDRRNADTLVSVNLPVFDLEGFNLQKLQEEKTASLKKVVVEHLHYVNKPAQDKENSSTQENDQNIPFSLADFSLGKNLPNFVSRIIVDYLEFKEAKVRQTNTFAVEKLSIFAGDIKIDQEPAFAKNRFLHATTFEHNIENLSLNTGEAAHKINLSKVLLKVEEGIGSLSMRNIRVNPEEENRVDSWLNAEIDLVVLQDLNTRHFRSGSFKLDSLLLHNPKIIYHIPQPTAKVDSVEENAASIPDLYPLIEGMLDSLSINLVQLAGADIRFAGLGGTYYGMNLSEAKMELQDIIIARGNAFLDGRVLHSSNIQLQLPSLIYILPDKVYSLQLFETSLSTRESKLEIETLRYGFSGNFAEILKGEGKNEIYRVLGNNLVANEIEWDKLLMDGHLLVNQFVVDSLDVYVYKDFNFPEEDKVKPMPYDLVNNMGLPLSIKEVMVKGMSLTYEEMTEGAEIAGLVELTDMEVLIQNLSNIKSHLVLDPDMTVIASGKLMGKGAFESTITVPLQDSFKDPRITGSLDTVDVTELNRIARYNSRISIETGMIYKAKWDFNTGEEYSYGDFEVSYEDLKIQLSEQDSPDTTGLLKKIGSFLANKLIINKDVAEEKDTDPKKVQFEQKRDKKRSFFNFYVKSLLGGLIEAVGVPFQ